MKLSSKTIEQLKNNRSLVESRDFPKIWETLKNQELNEAFIRLGLNPLSGFSEIPDKYFMNTDIEALKIPGYITKIGWSSFEDCTSLESVVIPDRVTTIGNSAFSSCYRLASIVIPDSVTSIGGAAFFNCQGLTSIVIHSGLKSIGKSVFSYCLSLEEIQFKGTKKEAIKCGIGDELNTDWRKGSRIKKIICTDGVINL